MLIAEPNTAIKFIYVPEPARSENFCFYDVKWVFRIILQKKARSFLFSHLQVFPGVLC